MKKILVTTVILIATAMIFSSFALANTKTQSQISLNTTTNGSSTGARGDIVWDNGMEYTGLSAAQYDSQYPFEAECADDFIFDVPTQVCDVHWIGGYWNDPTYPTTHWPWEIIFYHDRGDGMAPGAIFIGPFTFNPGEYTETLIEDSGTSIYYEFSVDLPQNFDFPAQETFWISIQGIGIFPPQCGWGSDNGNTIILHEMVFKSEFFGYADWTDGLTVFNYSCNMDFQLTTKTTAVPSISCEGTLLWQKVKTGATVNGTILVSNDGEAGSQLDWEVDSYPTWGNWTFTPESGTGLAEGDSVTITVEVVAPAEKKKTFTGTIKLINSDDPTDFCEIDVSLKTPRTTNGFNLLEWILQRYPNMFPILRNILA
jgi:hypothetical protein